MNRAFEVQMDDFSKLSLPLRLSLIIVTKPIDKQHLQVVLQKAGLI